MLDPALDADCVTFAAAALAGPVRAGLLDRALGAAGLEPTDGTGSWLGWHRQEVAAGLLVTVGLLVLLGPLRRRRARPAHH